MKKNNTKEKLKALYEKVEVPSTLEETYQKIESIPQEEIHPIRKKKFSYLLPPLVTVATCAVALAIILPFSLKQGADVTNTSSSISPLPPYFDDQELTAVAKQSLSLLSLLPEEENISLQKKNASYRLTDNDYRNIAKDIDEYIEMVEELEHSESIWISLVSEEEVIHIRGKEESFDIHYEEETISPSLQTFEGTIEKEGTSYSFLGRIEDKEGEKEIETTLFMPNGDSILVEQEIENRENEYTYSYFSNGNLTPYKVMEYEQEIEGIEGESSLEIEENGISTSCSFSYIGEALADRFYVEYEKEDQKEIEANCQVEKVGDAHRYKFEEDGQILYEITLS